MSRVYVPGPVYWQVGTGESGALEGLGWTAGDTQLSFDGRYEDVNTDVSGPAVPDEVLFLGESAMISGTLTRYTEAILAKLTARLAGTTPGIGAANSIGTLLHAEAHTFRLLLQAPYATAKAAAFPDMQPAYSFPCCYLADNWSTPLSVRVKQPRLMIRAIPVFDHAANSYVLYNSDTTGAVSPA